MQFVKSLLIIGSMASSLIGAYARAQVVREQNRDRARQSLYETQNTKIVGVYQGATDTADIFLVVGSSTVSSSPSTGGVSVSVPTLAGSFIISPKVDISSNSKRVQYAFPFSDGAYDSVGNNDAQGGRLSLTTKEQNGFPNLMTCDADANRTLSCSWIIAESAKFNLRPSSAEALQKTLNTENKADVVYVGHSDKLNAVIQFYSGVIAREGELIPQPTLLGNVIFFERNDKKIEPEPNEAQAKFGFKNGTYDLLRGQVVLTMDDDSQGTMNCKILKKGQSLNCIVYTRVRQEFTLNRTIRQ